MRRIILMFLLLLILTNISAFEKTYDIDHVSYYTLASAKFQKFVKNAEIITPLNADNKTTITKDTILIGNPEENSLTKKYIWAFKIKINETFPGKSKGVIQKQIINGHTVILLAGSDIQGTYASIITFANLNDIPEEPIICETSNEVKTYSISLNSEYFREFVEEDILTPEEIEKVKSLSNKLRGKDKKSTIENIAKWVANNIHYDYDKFEKIEQNKYKSWKDIYNTPLKTVSTKKGVCLDYATLTSALLLNNDITPYILDVALYNASSLEISSYHASVAVKINSTYFVIDQKPNIIPINEYVTTTFRGNQKIASIVMFKVVKEGNSIKLIKEKEIPTVAIYEDLIKLLEMRFNN